MIFRQPPHSAFAAVERGADLHGGGFDEVMAYPSLVDCSPAFGNR
jgi:hypothetical protein